jgi:hypothetical protein
MVKRAPPFIVSVPFALFGGSSLTLGRRAPVGDNPEDYAVLENGVVVGRIFKVPVAPPDRPWMWASGHSAATVKRAANGYEPTREAAMAAFAKSWRPTQ